MNEHLLAAEIYKKATELLKSLKLLIRHPIFLVHSQINTEFRLVREMFVSFLNDFPSSEYRGSFLYAISQITRMGDRVIAIYDGARNGKN